MTDQQDLEAGAKDGFQHDLQAEMLVQGPVAKLQKLNGFAWGWCLMIGNFRLAVSSRSQVCTLVGWVQVQRLQHYLHNGWHEFVGLRPVQELSSWFDCLIRSVGTASLMFKRFARRFGQER